ncbi:uncharacterized protein [Nicotiana tomentosiformis]|uniref:uncharacterized protein n=1 Tax=Nicotiana tomentosiformis TaxID=4098 RepID=UPI00388CB962
MKGCQSSEASPDVVTGILTVQYRDVYALIDPGSTLSYVTPYVVMEFGIEPEQLHESFSITTPVGESIVATRVHRDCVVTVRGWDTMADLIELGMVDFNVIMGMDWLYSCFAKLDCRTKTIRFEFPKEPVIEWKGDDVVPKGRFISYLKSTKMINKGCIYHLARVTNTDVGAPTLASVPVVNEFMEVFPNELPRIPRDREIDFGIDVMPGMQPIYIPPYRMAPAELKELKEQLKDLLEKGFLRPNVLSRGALVLFVRKKDGSPRMCIDYRQLNKIRVSPIEDQGVGYSNSFQDPSRGPCRSSHGSFADPVLAPVVTSSPEKELRKFVKGFSTLASPLTKVTQNAVKFQWSDTCKRSFLKLKSRLTTTPVLTLSEVTNGFVAMEKVKIITERLKTAHSRQKSYSDIRHKDLEFKEDDWVFLKVSPMKGIMRDIFSAPVFHVSMLKKVVGDPSLIVPVEAIKVNEEWTYEEIPVDILDRQARKLRNKEIASVKVLRRDQQVGEATWEVEEEMKKKYPHLFE